MRKYQELLARHEKLVHKLELRNDEHISTHTLSTWAMETSASALALIGNGVVMLANQRWHELSRSGPWYRVQQGQPQGTALLTLRQIAESASLLLKSPQQQGLLVERYQEQAGVQTLEVRTERVGAPTKGRPYRAVLMLAHDITSQVQAEKELEQARATLAQQEHLRALGELSSGVAHDLNNTLNAMKLRLELIERDAEFAERHRAHLDALVRIVSDASTRIRHLQDFAQQRPEPPGEQVHLADIIHEAAEIARSDLELRAKREGIALRVEVELPLLPRVNSSATDLRYVFINLLLNARDAMPRGGTIFVRGTVARNQVVISVEDEGTGIPEAHLRSIFRPFFTTKGRQGTGLGLSMAYGVMSRTGGSITAANRKEGGAIFTLHFPLQASEPQKAPSAMEQPKKPAPQRSLRTARPRKKQR
ncbi:sensor histidine kinase [Hyalangium versicolor]|uniref:sensor histidine kinase n=1 Tax=Hyalangium versicolor TaxID=2861190 RepID=UPI001CD035E8|nr:HAMP domain-containing sensor histidine kinase [Hyalangium versicolor]